MAFKRIKDWATSIISFRTGDVIPVDGPSGTAKMSKDSLLTETAQNALAGNVAPAFDPTRTSANAYKAGEKVAYDGKTYVFKVGHYGAWSSSDVYEDIDRGSFEKAFNQVLEVSIEGKNDTYTEVFYELPLEAGDALKIQVNDLWPVTNVTPSKNVVDFEVRYSDGTAQTLVTIAANAFTAFERIVIIKKNIAGLVVGVRCDAGYIAAPSFSVQTKEVIKGNSQQIKKMEEAFPHEYVVSSSVDVGGLTFRNLNLNYSGTELSSANCLLSDPFLSYGKTLQIKVNPGYEVLFGWYRNDRRASSDFVSLDGWKQITEVEKDNVEGASYVRIGVSPVNPSDPSTPVSIAGAGLEINFLDIQFLPASDKKTLDGYIGKVENDGVLLWEQGGIYDGKYTPAVRPERHSYNVRTKNAFYVDGSFMVGTSYVEGDTNYDLWIETFDENGNFIYSSSSSTGYRIFTRHNEWVKISVAVRNYASTLPIDQFESDKIVYPLIRKGSDILSTESSYDFSATGFSVSSAYNWIDDAIRGHNKVYAKKYELCKVYDNEYPINYYKLGNGSKKLFLLCGQHCTTSDPLDSIINAFRFVRDLCCNNVDSDFMKVLKMDYTIIILPLFNPYGLEHPSTGRYNYNQVDLNRDWKAATQPEVQAALSLISDFAPDILIDLHTTGTNLSVGDGNCWAEIGVQSYSDFQNGIINYFNKLYDAQAYARPIPSDDYDLGTLSGYGEHAGYISACVEVQPYNGKHPERHTAVTESMNYCYLINAIKFMHAVAFEEDFSFEWSPNQKSAL